MQNLKEDKQ